MQRNKCPQPCQRTVYPNADYVPDPDYTTRASFPCGLDDQHRLLPSCPDFRTSSSCDDITKFKRYFSLLHTNNPSFSWSHYIQILLGRLHESETQQAGLAKSVSSCLAPASDATYVSARQATGLGKSEVSFFRTASEETCASARQTAGLGKSEVSFYRTASEETCASARQTAGLGKSEVSFYRTTSEETCASARQTVGLGKSEVSFYRTNSEETCASARLLQRPTAELGKSEISSYRTASDVTWASAKELLYDSNKRKTEVMKMESFVGSGDSECSPASSIYGSSTSLYKRTPMKKICEDAKALARGVCKKLDKLARMTPVKTTKRHRVLTAESPQAYISQSETSGVVSSASSPAKSCRNGQHFLISPAPIKQKRKARRVCV